MRAGFSAASIAQIRIVVLQDGRAVEDGRPDQLMRRGGVYRDLLRRQMILKEAA